MTSISDTLQELSETVESIENCSNSLTAVSLEDGEQTNDSNILGNLTVELELLDSESFPSNVRLDIDTADLMADGMVRIELECLTAAVPESTERDSNGTQSTDDVDEVEADDGEKRKNETPRHRDPKALREVYEEHDTFPEMTAALGVDVTPETVRQQMISHGIHEIESPSEETKNDDEPKREPTDEAESVAITDTQDRSPPTASTEAVRSDGGVAVDLTVDELKEIVNSSRTIREAQQYLELDREQTRSVLQELNILDLVVGRLSKNDNKDISESELANRLPSSN